MRGGSVFGGLSTGIIKKLNGALDSTPNPPPTMMPPPPPNVDMLNRTDATTLAAMAGDTSRTLTMAAASRTATISSMCGGGEEEGDDGYHCSRTGHYAPHHHQINKSIDVLFGRPSCRRRRPPLVVHPCVNDVDNGWSGDMQDDIDEYGWRGDPISAIANTTGGG